MAGSMQADVVPERELRVLLLDQEEKLRQHWSGLSIPDLEAHSQ